MAAINKRRVWIGAVAGTIAWEVWSTAINLFILSPKYAAAQQAGLFLKQPRYPLFPAYWILSIFVISYILAWVYVLVRNVLPPGPLSALRVGILVGFAASFPMNLSIATWLPMDRVFPLWWVLDLWVGCVISALVAGWIYKD